jgi:hypothetical protein
MSGNCVPPEGPARGRRLAGRWSLRLPLTGMLAGHRLTPMGIGPLITARQGRKKQQCSYTVGDRTGYLQSIASTGTTHDYFEAARRPM